MKKPTIRSTTVATVSVTVRVHVGSWGPDCTVEQGDCVDIETHVEGSK